MPSARRTDEAKERTVDSRTEAARRARPGTASGGAAGVVPDVAATTGSALLAGTRRAVSLAASVPVGGGAGLVAVAAPPARAPDAGPARQARKMTASRLVGRRRLKDSPLAATGRLGRRAAGREILSRRPPGGPSRCQGVALDLPGTAGVLVAVIRHDRESRLRGILPVSVPRSARPLTAPHPATLPWRVRPMPWNPRKERGFQGRMIYSVGAGPRSGPRLMRSTRSARGRWG
jgi:hypothetical protein